jgi:flagellar hook assembly protein FlgD
MYNMIVNLGKPAHVQVDVYTIQGAKVKGLLDSDLAAGAHTVSWDGKNEDGSLVSSDMYVVLIYQDGHLSQKKKVIIQR